MRVRRARPGGKMHAEPKPGRGERERERAQGGGGEEGSAAAPWAH